MGILVDGPVLEDDALPAVAEHLHGLLDTAPEERNLKVERPAVHVVVEVADVGVVALFVIGFGAIALGQHLGQRGLSASDVTGNGNIH